MGIIHILTGLVRACLRLRYRIIVQGLDALAAKPASHGTLYLPNHPALVDPLILFTELWRPVAPSFLADRDQIQKPVLRSLAPKAGIIEIPSLSLHGESVRPEIERALQSCIDLLNRGGSVVLYPAGRTYTSRYEKLGGNSAVERLLAACPEARVVLVRTRGLWGSSFGRGQGTSPEFFATMSRGIRNLLASGIFFAPRRRVVIEFHEAKDLPRNASRAELNAALERFYNADAPPALYVPYTPWERGGSRELPEPTIQRLEGDLSTVPAATRQIVINHVKELCGRTTIRDEDSLSADLGLDSLARVELALWVEREFGHPVGTEDLLQSVGDVLLSACGNVISAGEAAIVPPAPCWKESGVKSPGLPAGDDVLSVFVRKARASPDAAIVADETGGTKRYRDLLTGVLVLRPFIAALPGTHIGIMLPASVGAATVYFAALAAGKTPVMVNWTVGARNMRHSLDLLDVRSVLTAKKLVDRIESQGTKLDDLRDRFVMLEAVRATLTTSQKLKAAIGARLGARSLDRAKVSPTAVVLFTSGSESLPKAVPLTHGNLLANMRDIEKVFVFEPTDVLVAMLPPFHSFGITVTTVFPLCCGIRTFFHPNPTEGGRIAKLVEAYGISLLVGTPTFVNGILRAGQARQFGSLRAVIAGAEKCPEHVYAKVREIAPQMTLLEGYGITECSPVVSINDWRNPRPGTIGKLLPSVEHRVVDPELLADVPKGGQGMLLVRGPSIFGGYLNHEGPTPFVEVDGKAWYRTGDLVTEDAEGVLTFRGRLKRFVKIGGEMISLPAIEEVLQREFASPDEDGPVLAVEGTPVDTNPELVLFTTKAIDRESANECLRKAGLSPLHFIRHIRRVEEIPVLGTGKTDYRALRSTLQHG